MGIGISIIAIAIGAILTWAVTATVAGVTISNVGVILMIVGALGLMVSLVVFGMERNRVRGAGALGADGRTTVITEETVR